MSSKDNNTDPRGEAINRAGEVLDLCFENFSYEFNKKHSKTGLYDSIIDYIDNQLPLALSVSNSAGRQKMLIEVAKEVTCEIKNLIERAENDTK